MRNKADMATVVVRLCNIALLGNSKLELPKLSAKKFWKDD